MAKTNVLETKFNGDKEAYRKYMAEIGKRGGKAKVSKGRNKRRDKVKSV